MMAKALSISILFLITQLNAQSGYGCAVKTCPIPGQMRMDIVLNSQGQYLSGCNCVNLITYGRPIQPNVPPPTQPYLQPPPIATPTTITVTCDGTGQTETLCQCPPNHIGACLILCQGTDDACKSVTIQCNNGYPCVVDCIAKNACSSSTIINGPTDAALTVNCLGEKSCDSNTEFHARRGTDLTVICNGMTSCKDAVFNFGNGMGTIECNGMGTKDACLNARFNLLTGQRGFRCLGSYCPPDTPQSFTPLPTRQPTSRPTPRPTFSPTPPTFSPSKYPSATPTRSPTIRHTICNTPGDCICPPGGGCIVECNGAEDACKDGLILCNNNGYPCVVDCIAMNSCSGKTTIVGPVGASLTVNCYGAKSCEGSFIIDAADCTNTEIVCRGGEACKGGSVVFYLGIGINSVICSGYLESCKDAQFILPYNGAVAFACAGTNCPATPKNFGNINAIQPIPTIQPIVRPMQPLQPTLRPIQPQTVVGHCCLTSTPGDKLWRGKCWQATSKTDCFKVNTRKCDWDPTSCLPNPPINTFRKVCRYYKDGCIDASDCCSEVCTLRISGSKECE